MSDNESTELEPQRSLDTDDAMVWAEEFCRIFNGYMIVTEPTKADMAAVDPGGMVGWFANAIEAARAIDKRKREIDEASAPLIGMVPEAQREAFVEGFDEGRSGPTDLDDPTAK